MYDKEVEARVESVKAAYDRIRNFLNLLCTVKSFESAINPESRTYYESFSDVTRSNPVLYREYSRWRRA